MLKTSFISLWSHSSNPRSCISKSITVSEVILQYLCTSDHAKLRLGRAMATTIQCSADLCISTPHLGQWPRTAAPTPAKSGRQQEEAVSALTPPQRGATSSQRSVGLFLPSIAQQWSGTAAPAPPGASQEAGKAGKLTCASRAVPHNTSTLHLPPELLGKLPPSQSFVLGGRSAKHLSAILPLFSSAHSLLWQLPSWEEGLVCHLVFFVYGIQHLGVYWLLMLSWLLLSCLLANCCFFT